MGRTFTKEQRSAMSAEALTRAVSSASVMNYAAIYQGFTDRGIPESDINPRGNVFTFHAWKALGRSVKKGEHGVHVVTFIAGTKKTEVDGVKSEHTFRFPKGTTVFHVSQTQEMAA